MAHKQQLVVATNNKGKLKEFSLLLPAFEIIAQSSLNIVPEEELGKTFFENSIQKARVANNASGIAALGDDSGLIVPAINSLTGLHSARYAHKNANDEENREHLKNELEKIDLLEAKAYFVCVLVLIQAPQDPFPLVATSMLEGIVKTNSQGKNGFGYDPMFYPAGSNHSLAEMDESEKAQISHRGKAVEVLQRKILGFSSE